MSANTLFKDALYTLDNLSGDVGVGRIGLLEMQRPFVLADFQLRALFGWIYIGHCKLAGSKE